MWISASRARFVLALLAGLLAAATTARGEPAITDIRLGVHPDKVRLVIDATEKIAMETFALGSPYRVVVDLPTVDWRIDAAAGESGKGFVSGYRFGHFAPGVSRVVLDLERPALIADSFTLPPRNGGAWRLVLDLRPATAEAFAARTRRASPESEDAGRRAVYIPPPSPRRRPAERKIVVIDPGHGGVDPGAIGRRGVYEKRVTLAMGKELRKQLQATGRYRVVMTRDRDIFVRLRERVAMARAAGADLFISLHADSIKNPRVRGASVYTLSERASDEEAAALAAKENKADLIAGVDLSTESDEVANILIDLAQRETMNYSARFASLLVEEMRKATRFLRKSHRFAGFAVLKAPDVPSVLVEMGYLSNAREEARLLRPAYRRKLAAAIVAAVDRYFEARARAERR